MAGLAGVHRWKEALGSLDDTSLGHRHRPLSSTTQESRSAASPAEIDVVG